MIGLGLVVGSATTSVTLSASCCSSGRSAAAPLSIAALILARAATILAAWMPLRAHATDHFRQ